MKDSALNIRNNELIVSLEFEALESYVYHLTIMNDSDLTLENCSVDLSAFWGPGNFGLDDTHMPAEMRDRRELHKFERLLPKGEYKFSVNGWNLPNRFNGGFSDAVVVSFSIAESPSSKVHAMRVHPRVPWISKRQQLPQANMPKLPLRIWLRELRPTLGFLALGLFVILHLATRK